MLTGNYVDIGSMESAKRKYLKYIYICFWGKELIFIFIQTDFLAFIQTDFLDKYR